MFHTKTIAAAVALIQCAVVGSAGATVISFSNTYDWNATSIAGTTYTPFPDTSLPTWTHNLTFSPPATSILTASLDIRALGNGSSTPCTNIGELWFAQSSSATFLGNLSCSTAGTGWIIDTFTIPSSLYPVLPASGWSLSLRLGEGTTNIDTINLDYATLYGSYDDTVAAVPEPGTLALLGLGLLGLGLIRRKTA